MKAILISRDQLLYAFFENVHRQAFQSVMRNVFCVLVVPQSLACQKFLEVDERQCAVARCHARDFPCLSFSVLLAVFCGFRQYCPLLCH